MKFLQLKFIVPLIALLITACGNAATSTQATPVQQSDLRDKPITSITDDDLYRAMEIFNKPNKDAQTFKQTYYIFNALAQQRNLKAEYALGIWYADGQNPERNIEQALYWHTQAAEKGVQGAKMDLGFYYLGNEGFPQDTKKAEFWLLQAAQNTKDSISMRNLGIMYYTNTPPDYQKSIYWFDRAAQLGDKISYLNYVFILAKKLASPIDYELAYYRACILKRYQAENPVEWARLIKHQPEAEKALDVSGAVLERGLKEQDITRIQRQAISVDLSNELK